jgi:hypothetical protein
LWDIEGHLVDTKDYDFGHVTALHPAGRPIHDMWLRITINKHLEILDAEAEMAAQPYRGHCEKITPDYKKLIGLKIAPGFTQAVRNRLGGTAGCTHLTEMISGLATCAFQTLAAEMDIVSSQQPAHLNGCHSLKLDGPVVARYYPKWYRGPADPDVSPPPENKSP